MLLLSGDYEKALSLLPQETPVCDQDWIGWHIRGMALLRAGRLPEAIDVFRLGVDAGPPFNKDFFRAGLAFTQLRQGEWTDIQEQIDRIENPRLAVAANVIQFHLYAGRNDREGMERTAAALHDQGPAVCIELTAELRRRFLEKKEGRQDDQWLQEQEFRCLLLAA